MMFGKVENKMETTIHGLGWSFFTRKPEQFKCLTEKRQLRIVAALQQALSKDPAE